MKCILNFLQSEVIESSTSSESEEVMQHEENLSLHLPQEGCKNISSSSSINQNISHEVFFDTGNSNNYNIDSDSDADWINVRNISF